MKFGSLFAGIGGLDLGLERAGMTCVWQVEKDEFCRKVLTKHWPDVPKYGDIFDVDFTQLPHVDLMCGGFPCQPFSTAGNQKGAADERFLWPEFARAICEVKPRWVLLENVTGLLSMASELGDVFRKLSQMGFDAEWGIISACSFKSPHMRKRLFILANSAGIHGGISYQKRTWGGIVRNYPKLSEVGSSNFRHVQSVPESWATRKPGISGVDDGVPARMDRIRALGNAVVPQVAEWIGRRIMECENGQPTHRQA